MGQKAYYEIVRDGHVVVLKESKRVDKTDPESVLFESILQALRNDTLTTEQAELLRNREHYRLSPEDQKRFDESIHLFARNVPREIYNLEKLLKLDVPIARLKAVHNKRTAKDKPPFSTSTVPEQD